MTSKRRVEGVQAHVDGWRGSSTCGRPYRKLKLESTDVIMSSSHAKKLASFFTRISSLDGIKSGNFSAIEISNKNYSLNKLQSYCRISASGPAGHYTSRFKRAYVFHVDRVWMSTRGVPAHVDACGQGEKGSKT